MQRTIKCVVVGDGSVGKTSMIMRFTTQSFLDDYVPTIYDSQVATLTVDGTQVNMVVWDTAGQEDYDCLRPLCYPGTHSVIMCYSVDSPASLENVWSKWFPEVRHHLPHAPIILVATKVDLREDQQSLAALKADGIDPVTFDKGLQMAKQIRATKFLECSTLTQQGLSAVFDEAVRAVLHPPPVVAPRKRRGRWCAIL